MPVGLRSLTEQSIDIRCRVTGYESLAGRTGATHDVAYVILCTYVCVLAVMTLMKTFASVDRRTASANSSIACAVPCWTDDPVHQAQ